MGIAKTIELCKQLITFDSVSRVSNDLVSQFIAEQLKALGFEIELVPYQDGNGISKTNVVARKGQFIDGVQGGLAYFSHSDVVPADDWNYAGTSAFSATLADDRLYGRGACDMKGSIACMLTAAESVRDVTLQRPLYFVCTADEEVGFGGASQMVANSELYREMVANQTHAIIGEPTSMNVVYAHKGIVGLRIRSNGRAAHSGTSEGINANLPMIPFLAEMKAIHDETLNDTRWQNEEFDPPFLSWNIGINDFTHAYNITPATSLCTISFRPMPGQNADELIERVRQAAENHGLEFEVDSRGDTVYTEPECAFVQRSLRLTDNHTPLTVSYGTDGGELHELHSKIVCGPGDIRQAHTKDEWIAVGQLEKGSAMYERFIRAETIDL